MNASVDLVGHENWTKRLNEILDQVSDEDSVAYSLEMQWEQAICDSWAVGTEHVSMEGRRNSGSNGRTIVDVLNTYFDMGVYPPPELLLTIGDMFQTYYHCKGKVSLEEVFFGKSKRGVGNHSARRVGERGIYFMFHFGNAFGHLGENSNSSLEEKAEQFLAQREERKNKDDLESVPQDVESFLRGYRRWKLRNNHSDNK